MSALELLAQSTSSFSTMRDAVEALSLDKQVELFHELDDLAALCAFLSEYVYNRCSMRSGDHWHHRAEQLAIVKRERVREAMADGRAVTAEEAK